MAITVRAYTEADLPRLIEIWNEVVEDGVAFPQTVPLDADTGRAFFADQNYTAAAVDESGKVIGLYILHPNNIGRCGHICNASYAVDSNARNCGAGRALVSHCLAQGKALGYRILQFNAVVADNSPARHLYESLGFVQLGVIPGGFLKKNGEYQDICPYYHLL